MNEIEKFIEDEERLIRTLVGAKEKMTDVQWQELKTDGVKGIYTQIEDIIGDDLDNIIV